MKIYSVRLFVFALSVTVGGISGMEVEQKVSMIERKATLRALATMSFTANEKVLHIGPHREEIIRKKALGSQIYCIDTDTLSYLQEPAQKYDKVLSFAYWGSIKNPEQACINSALLLKDNGQFCAVLPYGKSSYLNTYHQVLTNDTWKQYHNKDAEVSFYNGRVAKKLLIKAGLGRNVDCVVIKKPFKFKSKELFAAWIQSCPGQLDEIPQERCAEFINDVIMSYLQKHPLKEDSSVKLYFPYMIVSGYKS